MTERSTGVQQAESPDSAGEHDRAGARRIVVGVDGSDGSLVALAWAMDEARRRRASVEMVLAWQTPEAYGPINILGADVAQNYQQEWAERARGQAEQLADEVRHNSDGVELSWKVVQGHPARALIGVATEDDLLVVGTRGHGGFVGALIGSVSQLVVSHAVCPVVVVPPLPENGREEHPVGHPSYRSGVFAQAHQHFRGEHGSGVFEQGHRQPGGQGVYEQGRDEDGEGVFDQGRPHAEDV